MAATIHPGDNAVSDAIGRLVALGIAAGNSFDEAGHAADPNIYEMRRPITDAMRATGEQDPALAYTQTISEDAPQEGFIDEASKRIVLFPVAPEAIAAARAEIAARGITWRGGLAIILAAAGGAMLLRHGFDPRDSVIGLALLLAAFLLFRDDRRRKRRALDR